MQTNHTDPTRLLRAWERPEISSVGREAAHAPWHAYPSRETALHAEESPNRVSLDGIWQFRLYGSPDLVPENFCLPDAEREGFSDITVPGNWETQRYGEPIYTNVEMPWPDDGDQPHRIRPSSASPGTVVNPPLIPRENPTGAYIRRFDLPGQMQGKEVFLHFEGVETAFCLWVNGEEVGYSEDSKLPATFRITPFVHAGENTVALMVLRFSKGSYLEDQDYWSLSGIFRSVWLIAKSQLHIADYRVWARPDFGCGGGEAVAEVSVSRMPGYADCRVQFSLYDPCGAMVCEGESGVQAEAQYRSDAVPTANTGRVSLKIQQVRLWSPEEPALYRAVLTLTDQNGQILDTEACDVGFRRIEIRDGVILFNRKRLLIRGVNRHEFSPTGGRTVTRGEMIEEIRRMKALHINAVRTCHYPDCPEWYELCDRFGLLVVCECNLETHAVAGALTHNPAWAQQFLERAVRMAQTYKNHPSIYAWSLGNESGTGPNHAAMYGFLKAYDPDRLCQYESGNPDSRVSDVRGDMYATADRILQMLTDPTDRRPVVLVEYLYQISNSGGGMYRFLDLTERYPGFQGGFIWDWRDKALQMRLPDGRIRYAHGGDFGESVREKQNPLFMTNNGILRADLCEKPVAREVRQIYCPVRIDRAHQFSAWHTVGREGDFEFRNRTMTQRGSAFRCEAVLRENGAEICRWEVQLPDAGPMETLPLRIALPAGRRPDCIYHVEFIFYRRACGEAPEQEMGFTQFALEGGLYCPMRTQAAGGTAEVVHTGEGYRVSAGACIVEFDAHDGSMRSLKKGKTEYLAGPSCIPCFGRPRTGLDVGPGWGWHGLLQRFSDLRTQAGVPRIYRGGDRVRLEFPVAVTGYGVRFEGQIAYTVREDFAEVEWYMATPPSVPALSRAGLELILAPGFETLRSFSRGGEETYSDRSCAGRMQVWESTVAEQTFAFCPPSETGGHESCYWLQLCDASGAGIEVESDEPFHFDVRHFAIPDFAVLHPDEMTPRAEEYLHVDACHAPIGSDMAWSTAMPANHPAGGVYHHRFGIRLL